MPADGPAAAEPVRASGTISTSQVPHKHKMTVIAPPTPDGNACVIVLAAMPVNYQWPAPNQGSQPSP